MASLTAEQTGDWKLQLGSLYNIIDYLATAGHNNNAISIHVYLQTISKLPTDYPKVYQAFLEGFDMVRLSNRYWGVISTDLAIEQVLMRSMKSTGE